VRSALSGAASEDLQLASTQLVDVGNYAVNDDAGCTCAASSKLRDRTNASVGMVTRHVDHQSVARLQGDQGAIDCDGIRLCKTQRQSDLIFEVIGLFLEAAQRWDLAGGEYQVAADYGLGVGAYWADGASGAVDAFH
jgi:hypothetical protein